jgi:TolB-like protein
MHCRRAFGRIIEFEPSIAVLPFTNMSGDNEKEDFADGMLDEIIPRRPYPLARVSGPPTSRVG